MKISLLNLKTHLLAFLLLLIPTFAFAIGPEHGVRVVSAAENGGGYTIENNRICYVITAKHVVTSEDDPDAVNAIRVTDRSGVTKTAAFEAQSPTFDLVLYRITEPAGFQCGKQWNDGTTARSSAENSGTIYLLKTDDRGNQERIHLDYVSNKGANSLIFYPKHTNRAPQAGDSGSPVFGQNNQILGIAKSIDATTGEVDVINQQTIDTQFGSRVVSEKIVRFLVSQMSFRQRGENRYGTLTLLDNLENVGAIALERNAIYAGTQSTRDRVDPRLARRNNLPLIPISDYLIEADIVSLNTDRQRVKKYSLNSKGSVEQEIGNALGEALIGGIFGKDKAKESAQKRKRELEKKRNETIYVTDINIDVEFRITNTTTGQQFRHRERKQGRLPYDDRNRAEEAAISSAISTGLPAALSKIGF